MSEISSQYTRDEVLKLSNFISQDFELLDAEIFSELIAEPRKSKKTRRGRRAGYQVRYKWIIHPKTRRQQYRNDSNLTAVYAAKDNRNTLPAATPSIFYTNCRSLNTWTIEELKLQIDLHNPQVICLTETWLNNASESNFKITDYKNHFSSHQDRIGGGVCILTHKTLQAQTHTSYRSDTISTIWVLVSSDTCRSYIIACVYHPPKANSENTTAHITETVLELSSSHPNTRFIITGDFNQLDLHVTNSTLDLRNIVDFHTRGKGHWIRSSQILEIFPLLKSSHHLVSMTIAASTFLHAS